MLPESAFARARRTGDPQTQGVTGERHYRVQQLRTQWLVARVVAFDQRHRTGERSPFTESQTADGIFKRGGVNHDAD